MYVYILSMLTEKVVSASLDLCDDDIRWIFNLRRKRPLFNGDAVSYFMLKGYEQSKLSLAKLVMPRF
jgi:hypothetical protein